MRNIRQNQKVPASTRRAIHSGMPCLTSRALPPSPASSGVCAVLSLACVLQSFTVLPRIALPSGCGGDTNVVSMANWAPPWRGSPSATTSKRLLSTTSCCNRSKSPRRRSNALELHLHGRLLLLLTPAPHLSTPTPLLLRMVHGGGQGRQVDGHTGSCEQTGGGANEVC